MVSRFPKPHEPETRGLSIYAQILMIVTAGAGAGLAILQSPPPILFFAFIFLGWILAVMIHEFGHALVAYWAGDYTVVGKGYLTMNPILYGDVFSTLIFPVVILLAGGIGFPGAAVYLRHDLMRTPGQRALASLAGPLGTLLVLLVLSVVIVTWKTIGVSSVQPLYAALSLLAFLQATALVLNLLPIPGFDGYGAIRPFMPAHIVEKIAPFESWVAIGAIMIFISVRGASLLIMIPASLIASSVGLDGDSIGFAFDQFRFWS